MATVSETRVGDGADQPSARPEDGRLHPEMRHTIAYRRDKLPKRGETERRTLPMTELRVQDASEALAEGDHGRRLIEFDGYASLFDRQYKVGPYTEEITRGAFKRSLGDPNLDVVLRTEHSDLPLARTTGRIKLDDGREVPTLSLSEDEQGLHVRALLDPQDPDVQRLVPKYRRGDLKEMSFAFRVPRGGDEWSEDYTQRNILAAELHRGDVSIVTYGASPSTSSTMRSEQAVNELREVGAEGMVGSLQDFAFHWVASYYAKNGLRSTLKQLEQRAGKVLSSTSMDTLLNVLQLISDADDAVDSAQPLLADLMGVPNPDADEEEGESEETELVALGEDGEGAEQRDDPTWIDWDVQYDLKNIKLAIAAAKADQLTDPDNGTDPDDAAVLAALDELDTAVDKVIVAQAKDAAWEENGERSDAYFMAVTGVDTTRFADLLTGEGLLQRADLADAEREALAREGVAMPDGSCPIRHRSDLCNAIRAFGAEDHSAVDHIKKRAAALDAESVLPEGWPAGGPDAQPGEQALRLAPDALDELELELRALDPVGGPNA